MQTLCTPCVRILVVYTLALQLPNTYDLLKSKGLD